MIMDRNQKEIMIFTFVISSLASICNSQIEGLLSTIYTKILFHVSLNHISLILLNKCKKSEGKNIDDTTVNLIANEFLCEKKKNSNFNFL